jgi:hypothetical protein
VCFNSHFVYWVFAQKPGYAAAGPGSAFKDGQGYAGITKNDAAGGEERYAAGFAVTAAVCAKRALASSAAAEEGEEAQEAQAGRFTTGYGRRSGCVFE